MKEFSFEEIAQVLWAFVKLESNYVKPTALLYAALPHWPPALKRAAAGGHVNSDLRPKSLSMLAHAYAKAHVVPAHKSVDPALDDTMLTLLAALPDVTSSVPKLAPQGLAVVLWAYAKLGAEPRTLDRLAWAMYPSVCSKLGLFTPQGLTMLTYALALARVRHEPLLDVVTSQCTARLQSFASKVRTARCTACPARCVRAAAHRLLPRAARRALRGGRVQPNGQASRPSFTCEVGVGGLDPLAHVYFLEMHSDWELLAS